jgi:hypothetical protein
MTMTSFSNLLASASGMEDISPSFQGLSSQVGSIPVGSSSSSAPPAASTTAKESWWEWLAHEEENVEEWVDGWIHKHVPNGTELADD